jgi:hypothetical protein
MFFDDEDTSQRLFSCKVNGGLLCAHLLELSSLRNPWDILTNIAAPLLARGNKELRIFPHVIAPVVSTLMLLLPLASYVLPPLPLIGPVVTRLGFASTPFPANILPLFVLAWALVGQLYATLLARRAPERFEQLGLIMHQEGSNQV